MCHRLKAVFSVGETREAVSITDATIENWLERNRGMQCTSRDRGQVCRGNQVIYTEKGTNTIRIATVVDIGPLFQRGDGTSAPVGVTIRFADGRERNTTIEFISPLELARFLLCIWSGV